MTEKTEEIKAFATVSELESGWHELTGPERDKAVVLLSRASRRIRSTCPGWREAERREPGLCADICCAMVQRAMSVDESGLPPGASQVNDTTGPFTSGYTFSNPLGDLYLLDSEKRSLGAGRSRAFAIGMRQGE
ncbi:Gp19/Gp15/Gp42 family protein [uncultured Bifidobacterium sp.]|uniref:Gp19/Gp15/Gp42 family protein n=1 Tax=uncultured Bifidobacterium sp. TaxID=165187 RepID=UPI0025F97111|nr:Gp19/Gp15/Gp42 family protein [uncultured Bifidobacterium sp.]